MAEPEYESDDMTAIRRAARVSGDVWCRIVVAGKDGKGLRLTVGDVAALVYDQAVRDCAAAFARCDGCSNATPTGDEFCKACTKDRADREGEE